MKISTHLNTFRTNLIKDSSLSDRLADMAIIEDCMNGDSFKHYYQRKINTGIATVSEDNWKKMFVSMNNMTSVVNKFTSFCPNLNIFKPNSPLKRGNVKRAEMQQSLVHKALKVIEWSKNLNEVYITMETKGDVFFYIYFDDENDKIPKLRFLNPKNMSDIILDSNGNPTAYIYKETQAKQKLDTNIGRAITLYTREVTWVFEKGKTTIIDPIYEEVNGKYEKILDSNGNLKNNIKVIPNRPSYIEDIPIVRFQTFKRFNEKFSKIPASYYIDHCLALDGLNSNIEQINQMLGYPVVFVIGGDVKEGEYRPGAFIYVEPNEETSGVKPSIEIAQITNGLESLFKQVRAHEDALYDLVGIVNKTAQEKLGNSDSGRVVANFEAQKKNKIELYVDNVLEGMELWIKILLKENNLYNEDIDYGVTLYKPENLSPLSVYEEQISQQNQINLKSKTSEEIGIEKGDSYSDIKARKQYENDKIVKSNGESVDDVKSANNL